MVKKLLSFVIIFLLAQNGQSQSQNSRSQSPWPAITKEMRPWTRWWWMGSAVDDPGLDSALTKYHQAGFGGVEITPIYGAVGFESKYIPFLSPEWIDRLSFTVKKAGSLGMGVDMNTGTGWPFGGPQITPELGSARLILRPDPVSPKGNYVGRAVQASTAYGPNGQVLSVIDKIDPQSHKLNWMPPSVDWILFDAWTGRTGQKVKRAAPGGEGLVMDHYDSTAVRVYLDRFTRSFGTAPTGVRAFFNDSYEVYGANWSPGLLADFQRRKGYDLRLYMRELFADPAARTLVSGEASYHRIDSFPAIATAPSADTVARVKSDYRDVFGNMLLDNFTKQWVQWSHGRGAISKNQAHGSPGNLLDLYRAADIPECEAFFGLSKFDIPGLPHDTADVRDNTEHDPIMFQFASSAAHFDNKRLASSETFVWLTEHFRTMLAECKPEVEKLWLAGINHVFFHGTTYSPPDIPWPGWIFYASSEFVPANSIWPHLPALNEYIARCQSILQAGRADNQCWVYWPIYDIWHTAKGMEMQLSMHNVDEWLYPTPFHALVQDIEKAGYSTDFVSDNMLNSLTPADPRIRTMPLLIPRCRFMTDRTLEHILALANSGATVIFEALPEDVPGLSQLDKRREHLHQLINSLHFTYGQDSIGVASIGVGRILLGNPQQALTHTSVRPEALCNRGLQYVRRDIGDGKYYFIVNHTAKAIDDDIPLNVPAGPALLMDPLSGRVGMARTTGGLQQKVHLQLLPGQSIIVRTGTALPAAAPWKYLGKPGTAQELGGPWSLQFTKGGPQLPSGRQVTTLDGWEKTDSTAEAFSGTGVYTSSFECKDLSASEYILELKGVGASAHIWINDKDAGWIWSIPFCLRVKDYLHTGTNTIRIEVANLMANRIRDMDRKKIPWRNYHEINFVSIQYKPFDASHWQPLPSGLTGPVSITPYSTQ